MRGPDMKRRIALAGSVGLVLAAAVAAPASADPARGGQFTLTCGAETVTVVTPPNDARWTPALVVGTTRVYIPVGFGGQTGAIYDPQGNILADLSDSTVVLKQGERTGQGRMTCTYTFTFGPQYVDEFGQDVTAEVTGVVYVKTHG